MLISKPVSLHSYLWAYLVRSGCNGAASRTHRKCEPRKKFNELQPTTDAWPCS